MKNFFVVALFFTLPNLAFGQVKTGEVLRFSAEVSESRVVLNWSTNTHSEMMLLYRSDSPFLNYASLATSVLLATFQPQANTYTDTPPANTNYYYALLFESDILSGLKLNFTPGKNTTLTAIRIIADIDELVPAERGLSFPLLTGTEISTTDSVKFSNTTETKIANLSRQFQKYSGYLLELELKDKNTETSFFRFPEETAGTESVSSLTLKRILDSFVNNKKWYDLEIELKQFLQLNHPELINTRASFYLAETYFFQHKYDSALLQFLTIDKIYKEQSEIWIKLSVEGLSQLE